MVEKIGVFVDAEFRSIASTVAHCGLTGVQIHSGFHSDLPARLRQRFGPGLRILQVLHFGKDTATRLQEVSSNPSIDAVLIDSRTATAVGGTGIAFDWQAARSTLFSGESKLKLIAAGGLTPANVAEAIATLNPWGVDAVSGLESLPGIKDADKVRSFVASAKSAAK
jgi:phosphoribosylanthranilate isomerase